MLLTLLLVSSLLRDNLKPVAPEPGAPVIGKHRPSWCKGKSDKYGPDALPLATISDSWADREEAMVQMLCGDPDEPVFQEQVGHYFQRWANYTGQNAAQLDEYFAAASDREKWDKAHEAACQKVAVGEESPEREQTLGIMRKAVVGCGYEAQVNTPYHLSFNLMQTLKNELWHFDRDAAVPSQLAAIYRVLACVGSSDEKDLSQVAKFAGCRADVAQLDEKKLVAEIAAEGLNEYARLVALQSMGVAKRRAAPLEAALQAKAKDADMREVLIDAPARAWKEWEAAYAANKAAIDAARAFEDKFHGTRKSATKGCLTSAYAGFDAFMKAHTGSTPEAVMDQATSPAGALLLEHVRSCNEAEGRKELAAALGDLVRWGYPRRGPRFLAHVEMVSALSKILADRTKFPLEGAMVSTQFDAPVEIGMKNMIWSPEKGGTVAKVTKKGDKVHVDFKTEKWMEDEVFCEQTNRIAMFERDGTPIYHRNCKATGRRVEKSSTSEPFWMWSQMADGIKPGTFVRYRTGANYVDMVFEGLPIEVWADKKAKKLVAVLGMLAK
ncbi:MAG: hypothetical protein IT381_22740 [Deltaproteobacteria bacterium]|nr:hypothetical protein [Deltaproteobacteria bacterium]